MVFIYAGAPARNGTGGQLLDHERMRSAQGRRPAADVAVSVTGSNGGAPCCAAASHAGHRCFTPTGSALGETGQTHGARCDCLVQFGGGHHVGGGHRVSSN